MENLLLMVLRFAALIPAIMIHEIAHGAAALWCGDTTARDAGRLSFNPLRHVDPFMSVILPAILVLTGSSVVFGGAKPVPVDIYRCRDPKKAYWITAVAGPASNLLQAFAGALLFHLLVHVLPDARLSLYLLYFLLSYVVTNVVLMVFNLVPVPPLDGSRVVTVLLPPRLAWRYAQLDRYGMLFVFLLLWIPAFNGLIGRAVVFVCRAAGLSDWLLLLLWGR